LNLTCVLVVKNIILLILKALLKGKFSYWRKFSKKVASGKSRVITPEQKIKLNCLLCSWPCVSISNDLHKGNLSHWADNKCGNVGTYEWTCVKLIPLMSNDGRHKNHTSLRSVGNANTCTVKLVLVTRIKKNVRAISCYPDKQLSPACQNTHWSICKSFTENNS